jgi:hypothetical protein
MDESSNPGENEEPGGVAGPNNTIRMKKRSVGGLVGETAGDALSHKNMESAKLEEVPPLVEPCHPCDWNI